MEKVILEFIRNEYLDEDDDDYGDLDANTRLIESGIVDSFSIVSLRLFIEREFNVKIPDNDVTAEAFGTVASIQDLVRRHQRSN